MSVSKLEYIWLDGYKPIQSLRSKTKIERDFSGELEDCPVWCFDGSSTEQAPGGSSDCLLKPVFITKDPQRKNAYLVMCEVLNPNGTAHKSNGRALIDDDDNDFWFGFEQEYFLWNPETPAMKLSNPKNGVMSAPAPTGRISLIFETTANASRFLGIPLASVLPSAARPYKIRRAYSNPSEPGTIIVVKTTGWEDSFEKRCACPASTVSLPPAVRGIVLCFNRMVNTPSVTTKVSEKFL